MLELLVMILLGGGSDAMVSGGLNHRHVVGADMVGVVDDHNLLGDAMVVGDDINPRQVYANSGQKLTIMCGASNTQGFGASAPGIQQSSTSAQATQGGSTSSPGSREQALVELLDCQWSKDGFGLGLEPEVSGWPRYSLVGCHLRIDPVLPMDEGHYRCQATPVGDNKIQTQPPNQTQPPIQAQSYNASVMLSVNVEPGPPWIFEAKVEDVLEVYEGEEVELVCQSQGAKPAAQIQWNHQNGQFGFVDVRNSITRMAGLKTFKTVSKLKFKSKENLNITCTTFNEWFPVPRTSRAIEIKVKHPRIIPQIQMEFSRSKIREGQSVEVRCIPKADVGLLKFAWFINDKEVEGSSGNVLTIGNADKKYDKAEIKCTAENESGRGEITRTLSIEFSPKILVHPSNKMAGVGETVVFNCQADAQNGEPQPQYIWFKGKTLVGDSQNLSIIASEEAEGEYVCHVLVPGHQTIISNPASLTIKRKPKILGQTSKLGIIDKDAVLECTVESMTESRILWIKDNEPMSDFGEKYQVIQWKDGGKQRSYLIIFNLNSADFANYGCFASNEVGTDYWMISLEQEQDEDLISIIQLICSNIVLIIIISLGCLCYRCTKSGQEREKTQNFQNADMSNFYELLPGNHKEMNQDSIEIRQNMKNMDLVSSIFDELLPGNHKDVDQNSFEIRQSMKNMDLVLNVAVG